MNELETYFSNTNSIIIKLASRKRNMRESGIKYYLASKTKDEIYFYDGLEILFDDGYKYDGNSNLQILNDDDNIIQEIKKEKYFSFKEEDYFSKEKDQDFNVFIKLPLPRPINLAEFKKKHDNPMIILEGKIKNESIEELLEKQEKTIHSDAINQFYNQALEKDEFELE